MIKEKELNDDLETIKIGSILHWKKYAM